jgi:hypothetical protein
MELDYAHSLKIALLDTSSNNWGKWVKFPGFLLYPEKNGYNGNKLYGLTAAIDVHRNMLDNEIVIESDYPTYEENYEASKLIGQIIEDKGFQPNYYYSGNKSIHIHVFFDWDCLKELDDILQDQLRILFRESLLRFKKSFITWLRTKMITCWDTNAKKFDTQLIQSTHLIRCELSKNKKGYKTFLGHTYKDMSFVPYICNEKNRIYPRLGDIRLSKPNNVQELIEEFIENQKSKKKKEKANYKNRSLGEFFNGSKETLRGCVGAILSEDFKKVDDGYQRAMFILLNELRRVYGDAQARIVINDWNFKMDYPIKEKDIDYRFKSKIYSLSCEYIHNFLKELGIDVSKKCKGKLYK